MKKIKLFVVILIMVLNINAQDTINLNGYFLNYKYIEFCGEDCYDIFECLFYMSDSLGVAKRMFKTFICESSQLKLFIDTCKFVFYNSHGIQIYNKEYYKSNNLIPTVLIYNAIKYSDCIYSYSHTTKIQKLVEKEIKVTYSVHKFNLDLVSYELKNQGYIYLIDDCLILGWDNRSVKGFLPIRYNER
ncbi:MAG: hypothetical protein PHC83_03360 [Bacteroidales bacterium]|jgi:hypothetical protein|nr:hypothetical protein [Bacteroidales bacterium]